MGFCSYIAHTKCNIVTEGGLIDPRVLHSQWLPSICSPHILCMTSPCIVHVPAVNNIVLMQISQNYDMQWILYDPLYRDLAQVQICSTWS